MHLNSRELELPHSPEFTMFLNILSVLQDQFGLRAFRTEVSLFHCGLCLAGQAMHARGVWRAVLSCHFAI